MVVAGQRMPERCVSAGCSNVTNLKAGISYRSSRSQEKEEKRCFEFVRLKGMKWQPSQSSVLCSEHFRREDFARSGNLGDEKKPRYCKEMA